MARWPYGNVGAYKVEMYILKNKFYIVIVFLFDLIGTVVTTPFRLFRTHMPKDIKKILVIRLDHIGDLIFSTPTFRTIKKTYPEVKLDILVSRHNKDIVKNSPFIDEIMTYDAPWFKRKDKRLIKLKEFIRLIRALRKERYDIGIDLRGDLRHIILMYAAGIKYKLGYGITGGGFLLDKEISYFSADHEIEHNLNLLKAIGIESEYKKTEFFVSDEDRNFAENFCSENGLKPEDFIVCLHPGAGYPSKRWISKRWAQLIDRLAQEFKAKVIIAGTKEDKVIADNIKKMIGTKVVDAIGKTSLGKLAALLKKAKLFIGTDSGPSHIASAMGIPSVILYSGTNDSKQWAPLGKKIYVIQKDVPCKGCEKLKCANNICMDLITVDEVFDAAKTVVSL